MSDPIRHDGMPPDFSDLTAVYVNRTLTPSPQPSHTQYQYYGRATAVEP